MTQPQSVHSALIESTKTILGSDFSHFNGPFTAESFSVDQSGPSKLISGSPTADHSLPTFVFNL